MFNLKVKNRFGEGTIRKCRGCKCFFGFYTDRWGLGRDFIMADFELEFSMHEINCMIVGIFIPINVDQKVGTFHA